MNQKREHRASLYVHVPFCERKCVYCDFYSIENTSRTAEFLQALLREIPMQAHYGSGMEFETIFLGGGTPSLLEPGELNAVLSCLRSSFSVAPDAEITVETNPGTVTQEKLSAYRELGVNRLSIGIQSFSADELHFLSRIHDADQAVQCVEMARQAGFNNINLDLIFSLPGQMLNRWEENLLKALELHPEHLSAYSLIVENHTPLFRMVQSQQVSPNPVETEAAMYERTMKILEDHGFEHYEVSNYARPGLRSRHNYNYWSHRNYLGFGPSAHSFWKNDGEEDGRRWWNIPNLSTYCTRLKNDSLPVLSEESVGRDELITERIFLGLRSDGLDVDGLQRDLGFDLLHRQQGFIGQLVNAGSAYFDGASLRLTPKGFLLCDEICGRLVA